MTVSKAFDKFIRSRHLKGVSENTITSYRNLTARFIKFIGADTDMQSITQEDLENFIDYLYSIALSRNSIASFYYAENQVYIIRSIYVNYLFRGFRNYQFRS